MIMQNIEMYISYPIPPLIWKVVGIAWLLQSVGFKEEIFILL